MQRTRIDIRRVLAGKSVLGALAGLLVVSGMTTASTFIHVGELMAATAAQFAPALVGGHVEFFIVASIYLQAVVIAAVYRVFLGVYETLQRRADRTSSA